ncbi:MAG: type IV pilus modification protein PilV [Roseateles sp.]|uniref:type IV pilus modification protein PilV n=1 Tax=Roseateles sp. TaxID=1971397 RepID=UPI0039EBBAE2
MTTPARPGQRGVLLLEVLVALLIFSLGVLGLVGLQASAAKQSGETKYRADATLLANELLGQMRLASRSFATLQARFQGAGTEEPDDRDGADYTTWRARVAAQLPGAAGHPPIVTLTQNQPLPAIVNGAATPATGLSASTLVSITVRWKAPNAPASEPVHNIVLTNEIR